MPDPSSTADFVGRKDELAIFERALAAARQGTPAALLVGGEAGIGKSTLVMEAARRSDAQLLVGRCIPMGGGLIPLAPLAELVRNVRRTNPSALSTPAAAPLRAWVALGLAAEGPAAGALFAPLLEVVADFGADDVAVVAFEDLLWSGDRRRVRHRAVPRPVDVGSSGVNCRAGGVGRDAPHVRDRQQAAARFAATVLWTSGSGAAHKYDLFTGKRRSHDFTDGRTQADLVYVADPNRTSEDGAGSSGSFTTAQTIRPNSWYSTRRTSSGPRRPRYTSHDESHAAAVAPGSRRTSRRERTSARSR